MKKYAVLLTLLSLCLAPLSGCQDYREVEHLSIVAGCALDKSDGGKTYHLSVEVLKPSGEKNSETKSIILEAEGDTFFEAIRNLNEITPKKPYWSNCQILVVSEELAEEGILPVIDFCIRELEIRPTLLVLISQEKTAREIIMQKNEISSVVSFGIKDAVDSNNGLVSTTNGPHVLKIASILDEGSGTALTLPAVRNTGNNGSLTSELNGVAVFRKDKLVGYLSPEDTKYFLFVTDKVQGGVLSGFLAPGTQGLVAGKITRNITDIEPIYENGQLTVSIQTKTFLSLKEQGTGHPENEEDIVSSAKEYWEESLKENICRVIRLVQVKYGQDIFGFGTALSKKNPEAWNELSQNWDSAFRTLKTEVSSGVVITDTGIVGNK